MTLSNLDDVSLIQTGPPDDHDTGYAEHHPIGHHQRTRTTTQAGITRRSA
jgi:hypothetical protein